MRLSTKSTIGLAGVAVSALMGAVPAFASGPGGGGPGPGDGGGGPARASGHCSIQATWQLRAKHDDNRIEAEFEVDQAVNGRVWHVVLSDNGTAFVTTNRRAMDGGRVKVEATTRNRIGPDTIAAQATNLVSGQTCRGMVRR